MPYRVPSPPPAPVAPPEPPDLRAEDLVIELDARPPLSTLPYDERMRPMLLVGAAVALSAALALLVVAPGSRPAATGAARVTAPPR